MFRILFFITAFFSIAICKPSQVIDTLDSNVTQYFDIQHITLKSSENPNSKIYKIHIAIPKIAAPNAGFKVLYTLDGNAFFPKILNLILRHNLQENLQNLPIIVAIGHNSTLAFDRQQRTIDYTPSTKGGISQFHNFITNTLKPYITQNYHVNVTSGIFGHSFGGLYVLYNAFNFPRDFRLFVAASPSLKLNGGVFQNEILHDFNARTLIITQGSLERISGNLSRENLYHRLLMNAPNNDIRFYDFYNKTHGGSIESAMLVALKAMQKL